ncbi:actin-related protein 8-like isoform X2 [Lotus japonicus]|uniref:actin-related protein 8-like isoform X2 n=1 Tax=Lotus japonicus TaxID=34305 RepID=UPI002584C431|nr:actin-related protein 8-like isoform X2 [Lotus japonicus]
MSFVLRKLWEMMMLPANNNNNPSSSWTTGGGVLSRADLGVLEKLPWDVLMQILKLLDPKEAAKVCVVCKVLRSLVSDDNRLWLHFLQTHQADPSWDSVFFAETTLASGYPLPSFIGHRPQLSFKHIYGQRAQVPGAIIIDGGSGYCKFGWSKYACPSGRSATFLEFGNIESPMYTRLRHFYATIYNRMQVKPNKQPVIVSIPIVHYDDTESAKASRRQLKEAIYTSLFDMNVPAVCAVSQATLALYAAKRTSGIAVNIGFQVISVVPILNGKVMRKVGVEVVGLGALKLTEFLKEKMQLNNLNFQSLYTVRKLKENLCYVALDYEAELSKDTTASFEAIGDGWFTLSKERFQTGEILFQPHLAGVQAMGLHQAIALCMDRCHAANLPADSDWYKTVVLSGGTACLPGLAERIDKELNALLPPYMSNGIRVVPPPYGADTPWFGAKIIGNLSTFPGPWCVEKKLFRQKPRLNLIW